MYFQIISISILLIFYGCYFGKMLSQKKKGIRTDQIGKDKTGMVRAIEMTMKVTTILVLVVGACGLYLNDYYHADVEAIEAYVPESKVQQELLDDTTIVYAPEEADTGIIFYPGGKVEYTSYIPLMEALASEGVLCVLVEMPFNIAILDMDAAAGIQEQFPQIENWYMSGHSLGGSMAASYLAETEEDFEGLLLLGSYSIEDLSESKLDVLSIYGSEDEVLNKEKYDECKVNLPEDYKEVVIEGGCHAYFGMYGAQEGDGEPQITNEEQIMYTADAIMAFVNK